MTALILFGIFLTALLHPLADNKSHAGEVASVAVMAIAAGIIWDALFFLSIK